MSGAGYRQKGLQSSRPGYGTRSAVPVTLDTALQLSAVWACVKLIAESISSLPLCIYSKDPKTGKRTELHDHQLAVLFGGRVNRWQTRNEFFETMIYQLALLGNGYAAIQRGSGNRIVGLIPLMTEQMQVSLGADGSILYQYTDGADVKVYSQESIWHNKLFGNGTIGLSPLGYARNSIGIGLAAEESVNKIYSNGGKPSGVLTIDKLLTEDQRNKIKENFKEMAEGENSRLFVLEAGMQYQQVSLSPTDIELLASRKFQIEDIARFFGVPSVLINDTSASTTWGSGIEQIVQGFYKLGLRPYLERLESSMEAWLLTPDERRTVEIEFDFNSLLRPDMAERIKMYKDGVQGGIMTPNEGRKEEGWESLAGGDDLLVQRQMVALKDIGNVKDAQNVQSQPQN
jgi:HK97 family phage portal protein